MSLVWAPKMCSIRERIFDFVRLLGLVCWQRHLLFMQQACFGSLARFDVGSRRSANFHFPFYFNLFLMATRLLSKTSAGVR